MIRKSLFSLSVSSLILMLSCAVFADETSELEQAKIIVKNYIIEGKDAEAINAYQKFITDYASNNLLPDAVYDIAETYRNNSKFDRSLKLYQDVVAKWPDNSQAMWAQRGIAVSYIALGKSTEAQAELNKLKQTFSSDPNVAEAVFHVADAYYWFGKYIEANGVYKDVTASYPNSDFAMWAQMGLALSSIADNNDAAAEGAVEALISNYSSRIKLPEALFYVAGRYEWSKKYTEAESLYRYIIQTFPQSPQVSDAQLGLAKSMVYPLYDAGQIDSFMTSIDELISDFGSHPGLPWLLSRDIAERRFYTKALEFEVQDNLEQASENFTRAIAIWQKVINNLHDPNETPYALCWVAECYQKLGQYASSIEYYQRIADGYPAFESTWHALFMVGRNFEGMKNAGLISETEADERTKSAYQQLLQKYPECKAAKVAKHWIQTHN